MKRNEFVIATLASGGILVAAAAFAEVPVQPSSSRLIAQSIKKNADDSQGFCSGKRKGFMSDLTNSQLEKMVSLRDRFHIATAAKEAELKSIFHQTAAQLAAPTIDKKAIGDLHSRAAKLHGEISDEHLKLMTDTVEILTPQQRQNMYQLMLKHSAEPGPFHMLPPFMGPPIHGFPGGPHFMRSGPMGGQGGFPPGGFGGPPPQFGMPGMPPGQRSEHPAPPPPSGQSDGPSS